MLVLDQIRTVDKLRIIRFYKKLTPNEIKKCKSVLKESYVD